MSAQAQLFSNRRNAFRSPVPTVIVLTDKGNVNSTTGGTSVATTGSYTIASNCLALAFVVNTKATLPETPTFSGNGLTWVQAATVTCNTLATPLTRLTVFRAMTNITSTSTAGTADFQSQTQTGCSIRVIEFANVATSGSDGAGAVVQIPTARQDATADETLTMSALDSNSRNAVFVCAANDVNSASDESEEAGWTELAEVSFNTPATGTEYVYRLATTDNTVLITTTSRDWCLVAVEVKVLP